MTRGKSKTRIAVILAMAALVIFTGIALAATGSLILLSPNDEHHEGVLGNNEITVRATDLEAGVSYRILMRMSYHDNPRTTPPACPPDETCGWCSGEYGSYEEPYDFFSASIDDVEHTFTVPLPDCHCQISATFTLYYWNPGLGDWDWTHGATPAVDIWWDCRPGEGCTLTPGYWKTHSMYGPAPYDDTWALVLPDGEDTGFFDTGQTWYEVLWTEPKGGNAYYILAHAYIAATLNGLRGADTSAITSELAQAALLLDQYDGNPDSMDGLKGKQAREVRATFIALAAVLDDYNNGYIGPGHCWW